MDYLPSLMIGIRSVYNNSSYYNTSLAMTGLITKITNQLIIACKNYLTQNGTSSVWVQNKRQMISKMKHCRELKDFYLISYEKTLEEMENDPNEVPWEGSYVYIFGKFDNFLDRLEKVC